MDAIDAAATDGAQSSYTGLASITGNGLNDAACLTGSSILRFPLNLNSYNIAAQRTAFDLFDKGTMETPAFNNSFFLFEGYSVAGVQAIDSSESAYPHRADPLLV
jgi:hypothetical protein